MKRVISTTVAALVLSIAPVCLAQDRVANKTAETDSAADAKTEQLSGTQNSKEVAQLRAQIHRTMADLVEAEASEEPDKSKIESLNEKLDAVRARLREATTLSPKTVAQLRADIHRTTAELIKAKAATQPDEAKIEQLTEQLDAMRTRLQFPQGRGAANQCPIGGPGSGFGKGLGGCGRGVGPVQNQGQPFRSGPGFGQGQGFGQGPGFGQGQGIGRGQGPGLGRGQGQGRGRGQGRGPGRDAL